MPQITVVARIQAKRESADHVQEQFMRLIDPTVNNDEGCINYIFYQDNDDPALFYFLEEWESRELLDRHSNSRHVQACRENTAGMIEDFQVNVLTKIR